MSHTGESLYNYVNLKIIGSQKNETNVPVAKLMALRTELSTLPIHNVNSTLEPRHQHYTQNRNQRERGQCKLKTT